MVYEGRESQAHRYERHAMQGAGRLYQRVAHPQEFTTACYQYLCGRSCANSLVIAHQEWNLQHLFEVFDLNAERGLREIESLCGNADVTCFCDRNEVLEFL
jgi:hypothetical protein